MAILLKKKKTSMRIWQNWTQHQVSTVGKHERLVWLTEEMINATLGHCIYPMELDGSSLPGEHV